MKKIITTILISTLIWLPSVVVLHASGITLVSHNTCQTTTQTTTSSCTTPTGSSTATANLIVICSAYLKYYASTLSVVDSTSDTLVHAPTTDVCDGAGVSCLAGYYVFNPTTNANYTVTITTGNAQLFNGSVWWAAYSGTNSTPTPTTTTATVAGTGGGSQTLQPGSQTPSANGALIHTCAGSWDYGSVTYSITGGPTSPLDQQTSSAGYMNGADAEFVQTTAAAVNPTWTDSSPRQMTAWMGVFYASGGGSSGPPTAIFNMPLFGGGGYVH